ncbi:hypothetical protein BJY01DRAFT_210284 [Aspergillus pseudoustus]|uniref:Uncharacterized protein n=1 Tax=Aspergillus pseudoustus TaxID=1810923 RepID=A0ABR4KD25_9EURO
MDPDTSTVSTVQEPRLVPAPAPVPVLVLEARAVPQLQPETHPAPEPGVDSAPETEAESESEYDSDSRFEFDSGTETETQQNQQTPVEYRYHEYNFGAPDINWIRWLSELGPENAEPAENPDHDAGHGDEDEDDMEWNPSNPPENDDMDVDPDAASSSSSSRVVTDPAREVQSQENNDAAVDDETAEDEGSRPLTADDIRQLKEMALMTYPSCRFVELPQFKQFLRSLTKEQLVRFLRCEWKLKSASVMKVKTITTFTVQHPDPAVRDAIVAACGESVEENWEHRRDNDDEVGEARFDILPVLRAKSDESLRELARKEFVRMYTYRIIRWMTLTRFIDQISLAELYGSAVVLGGLDGRGFGLDSEDWCRIVASNHPVPRGQARDEA